MLELCIFPPRCPLAQALAMTIVLLGRLQFAFFSFTRLKQRGTNGSETANGYDPEVSRGIPEDELGRAPMG